MNDIFIISEIKVSYHPSVPARERPKLSTSMDCYNYFLGIFDKDSINIKEESVALFLNRANRILGCYRISSGGIRGTVVDIRIVLGIALKCLACGIILAHNHPSGELNPSHQDLEMTKRLKEAAKLMEISLLDHLIITYDKYYSFADEGIL
jgi:DNA repair protein RadC